MNEYTITLEEKAEHILEFDRIKELWSQFALTDAAKAKIRNAAPCLSETELAQWQKQTTEARQMIEKCGTPPLASFSGITAILEIAEKEGCLSAEQLEAVGSTLAAVRRLKDYLNRCKMYDFSLAYYEENLDSCDSIREEIEQQIRNGAVDDNATPLLASIRRELLQENTKMREKADMIIRNHKDYMADSFSTVRNGHICIPVKKEYRHKVSGSVLDKSASGGTVFIEPASVAKFYDTIQLLKIDEENEEMRIRYTLTALLLDALPSLTQNQKTIELLDFAFSKGRLSLEYDGIQPVINTKRRIRLTDARHPLMDKTLCVPLSFTLGDGINGIIITGPNAGGKTVTLKTVALCCMMAQCGLHVPCLSADICMNANYLCDIGDGQSITENLSTFSAHLKAILQILNAVGRESLVILDELGSGTDPTEGMGIAIAVLKALQKSNALFLVTTHYPEIKQFAEREPSILNARMDFDKESLKPYYRLILGESGESCAFYIARRLGMSDAMLEDAARASYGKDYRRHLPPKCSQTPESVLPRDTSPSASLPRIQAARPQTSSLQNPARRFHLGDSVMVYPDKKIGIVCQTANDKGVLRVQLQDKKIWINHKRVKLQVPATELYPEDYDFSIIFDTVENRKLRHKMERKYVEGATLELE